MRSPRRKAPSVPASLQRSASASNRRFSLPENWRRLAIATTSGSRRAAASEAVSPVALRAPSATASEEEEPNDPFIEDFSNEVMCMSYLYSKLPETGVSPHIGTGGDDAVIGHQPLELLAGVLAATIGVMQQRVGFAPAPDRHHQRVSDELGRHCSTHRPANHPPREQIDDGRHIEPAFRRPDIGEVSDPFAIGSGRFEGAVEHVGSDGGSLPLTQIRRQATPSRACSESNGAKD